MVVQAEDNVREGQRIAKVMARAGLCSRRDAEQWIAEGRVSVNGETLTSPAFNVSESDDVRVDGGSLKAPDRTRLFLFHKPRGLVTTARDPEGRSTIFDALPEDLPRVVAIGRLDINTEGLLLLTNDGGLSRILELPSTGWLRRYRVRAHGTLTQEQLDPLREGVTIDGVSYLGVEARLERQQGSNVWLTMGLREGKNREIKKLLEHLGLSVNRLIRISFGPFELADLAEGAVEEVRTRVLRDQLGPKLARAAGANFDAPIEAAAPAEPAREASRGDRPPRRHGPPSDRRQDRGPRGEARDQGSVEAPRKRKHVSALRAEAAEDAQGPRKRITRETTADRRGRAVQIERVALARPSSPTTERRDPPKRAGGPRGRDEAGAERAERPRRDRYDGRFPPREGGHERRGGEFKPRGAGHARDRGQGEREQRTDRSAPSRGREEGSFKRGPARAPREGFGGSEGRPERGGRTSDAPRWASKAGGRSPPHRAGSEDRPPRRGSGPGERSYGARGGPSHEGGESGRPQRTYDAPRRGPRSDARPRAEGAKPEGRPPRRGPGAPSRGGPPRGGKPGRGPRPPRS